MEFFDQIGKRVSQGLDRAKFEAEKFQKTARIQGELSNVKRMLDSNLVELGQRAYDLYRAGKITSPTVGELAQAIDELRARLVAKEEELKEAQSEVYITPIHPPDATSPPPDGDPDVHVSPPSGGVADAKKPCPSCGFHMPGRAVFCPNCGYRVDP